MRYRLLLVVCCLLAGNESSARWEDQAEDLPEWAQRGRMIFVRWPEGGKLLPEFDQWKPVLHLHGPRCPAAWVEECKAKQIPLSLRVEAVMFFGDDRAVNRIKERAYYGWREHSWCWQYNWWLRDPVFRQVALVRRDGTRMIEYLGNDITERETVNPLHPLAFRMRREVSQAVLTARDPRSPANPIYPDFPYAPYDDVNFGRKGGPFEYYPVFGHLSMLWYDNPNMWADASEFSQKQWRDHFRRKFGKDIADPAGYPDDAVRREWTRFWADAYGRYFSAYFAAHQTNVAALAVKATTTALDGRRVLPVGLNASAVSGPWGAQLLYVLGRYAATSFPGVLCEYDTSFTHGKFAPLIKFSMAAMRGRPTGYAATDATAEAEALALNGVNAYTQLTPRAKAYIQFQFDNRSLFTNAQQGNRVGILYNVREGLHSNTLIASYELAQQLDELGIPYDVIVEEDLLPANTDFLSRYAALLVLRGELNEAERAGLTRYEQTGGHVISIGGQVWTNAKLMEALKPSLGRSYRVKEPQRGSVCANVLRKGEVEIAGLINYSGQPQRNVEVLLPRDTPFARAAAISPDGYAELCDVQASEDQKRIVLPELHNYTAIVLGEKPVLNAALETVKPRLRELIAAREPLKRIQETGHSKIAPEDVPEGRQLSRLRHGSFETATFLMVDAVAPEQAKVKEPIRLRMEVISTGSHYPSLATMEYWRLRAVNVDTGKEVRTHPDGGNDPIDGVGVQMLVGDKLAPMPHKADELVGKTLVADFAIENPGRYELFVDYLYNNQFAHGDPGPRVNPAFPGDRPEKGWGFEGRPLKKHYLKHKFPGMRIEVTPE